ncbi:MAG: Hsp20/alpha crystallin family protein [Erysipelotrichaceae bacterium]|nr:Hsp20/alpha crystallin family protein [Erysipelotrichaceae bacterium]
MKYYPRRGFGVFDEMFDDFLPKTNVFSSNVMKTDIYEKDGYYNLDIELPGYDKEDVEMDIMDGYLNIKATHNVSNEEKDSKGNLVRSERSFGSCSRSFYAGDNIKAEDIKAKFENGMLNIVLPSKEQKSIETKQTVTIE